MPDSERPFPMDTSWLYEPPPTSTPQPPGPAVVPPQQPREVGTAYVDVTPRGAREAYQPPRRRVSLAGMPGRVSAARWSLGRTFAATVPITALFALLLVVLVWWLFGVLTWWATLPALLLGAGWLTIATVDAVRYSLRGGPPPPVL